MKQNNKIIILSGLLLLLSYLQRGNLMKLVARGIRNNNPGNIRISGDKWQGLSTVQTDKSFFQFVSPEYGIRALVKILLTYRKTYGLTSISEIINRWAPSSENDTQAYIARVSDHVKIDPYLNLDFNKDLFLLVEAIIKHENGVQPYSADIIRKGISLA
jgi:hypothetical protein